MANLKIGKNIDLNDTTYNISSAGDTTTGGRFVIAKSLKVDKEIKLQAGSASVTPVLGEVAIYVKNTNLIIAFNDGFGSTKYKWIDVSATDNPAIWNYDTTEPS